MGVGAVLEPLVVISLLAGGTIINRSRTRTSSSFTAHKRDDNLESGRSSPTSEDSLLSPTSRAPSLEYLSRGQDAGWRNRKVGMMGWSRDVNSPDTQQFADRLLSRLLRNFPFLVEVWYWALIYWVYQLGRAFTAVTLVQGTVHTARRHALQLVRLEQRLHIFWEPAIQRFFLQYPLVMHWINRIYSFIHIPGTILFLIGLYYLTITANKQSQHLRVVERSPAGPALYEARRRTMAMCNLMAFIVFTVWPCMPPRLLSDPHYHGGDAEMAKSFGFVDTVHGADGESSVWTQNKFCNQYAAMPSLHFGYSLLIGLTVAFIPLASQEQARSIRIFNSRLRIPGIRRLTCMVLGFSYPSIILVAIIATANHFVLDAMAGAVVCGLAWNSERFLLNLLPLEDWFLWTIRIHKPDVEFDAMPEWDEEHQHVKGDLQ